MSLLERLDRWISAVDSVCDAGVPLDGPALKRLLQDVRAAMTPNANENALKAAVAAIYFDDSSDFKPALLQVVRELGGREVAALLEQNPAEAYARHVDS